MPSADDVEKAAAVLEGNVLEDGETLDRGDLDDEGSEIPEELKFTTGVKEKKEPSADDVMEFEIDGHPCYARKPSDGAWTLILAAFSNASTTADRTNAIMQFMYATLDEASHMYVQNRLLENSDDFDVDVLAKVAAALLKKWAPKPNRADRRAAAGRPKR